MSPQGVPYKKLLHAKLAGLSIFCYSKKSLFPYGCVQTLINVFYMMIHWHLRFTENRDECTVYCEGQLLHDFAPF